MVLLCHLFIWKQCPFFFENPTSTILPYMDRPSQLAAFIPIYKITTYLGAFGGPSLKPVHIWSNSKAVATLERKPVKMEKPMEAPTR